MMQSYSDPASKKFMSLPIYPVFMEVWGKRKKSIALCSITNVNAFSSWHLNIGRPRCFYIFFSNYKRYKEKLIGSFPVKEFFFLSLLSRARIIMNPCTVQVKSPSIVTILCWVTIKPRQDVATKRSEVYTQFTSLQSAMMHYRVESKKLEKINTCQVSKND